MLITGTDFNDGAVNYSTCHFVEKERYEQDKHIQIKNGSILITKDGTLGKVAYVQGLSMPATLNAGVFNVEINDETKVDGQPVPFTVLLLTLASHSCPCLHFQIIFL